jgi:hypothetical protein
MPGSVGSSLEQATIRIRTNNGNRMRLMGGPPPGPWVDDSVHPAGRPIMGAGARAGLFG